ncbi:DUF937 domain-containing protein [Larkinella soli]|uniref:DUF937 domain-containing protein n=1 Tax=Larkinella soli TaxID=1770527 RepID=UPI000FFC7C14|nr:DUF937 domain-containing protein [Larkinella soli]
MAVNLLSFLQDQFTPSVIDQLSTRLGENPASVRKAVAGAVPAVLGGLARRVHDARGASDVIDVLKDGNYANTPLDVSQVTDSRINTQAAVASGSSLLDEVFGDDADEVAGAIAAYSGVQEPTALSLMGLAGSVMMNVLGQQYAEKGLSADNLRTLLAGQADTIRTSLPAGLEGLGAMLDFDRLHTPEGGPDGPQAIYNSVNVPGNLDIPKSPEVDRRRENNWQRWVLAALGLLIIIMLVQKCREPQSGTEGFNDTTATERR